MNSEVTYRDGFVLDWSNTKRVYDVPIDLLEPEPDNPRRSYSKGALDDLTESIADRGVLTEFKIRRGPNDEIFIVGGHRRYAAARAAQQQTVPCIVKDQIEDRGDALEALLMDNLHREEMPPIDFAVAIKELMDERGCSQKEVSDRFNIRLPVVSQLLQFLSLPQETRSLINEGKVPFSSAHQLCRLDRPATEINKLARKAADGALSAKALQDMVKNRSTGPGNRTNSAAKFTRVFPLHGTKRIKIIVEASKGRPSDDELLEALQEAISQLTLRL